jgi:hypothetical protein
VRYFARSQSRKATLGMRAVIAQLVRVDAPVVPFLAHQPGEEVAKQVGAVFGRLHMPDNVLQPGRHVLSPLR